MEYRSPNFSDPGRTERAPAAFCAGWGLLFVLVLATPAAGTADSFSAADFDTVLARHVQDGRVNYGALRADAGPLERFLARTEDADPSGWPRDDQMAFWVNVYNARVLDGVIRRPGLESVLDVGKIFGVPTLAFFRERRRSGGRRLSLSDIEHRILRRGWDEPRVHFVLNCASASCPVLPSRALRGDSLEPALRNATAAFLTDTTHNRFPRTGPLELSQIFKWYRGDFEATTGSVQAFIVRHWPGAPPLAIEHRPVRHLDYDWSLNGHW